MVKVMSRKEEIIQGYWETMIEIHEGLGKTK